MPWKIEDVDEHRADLDDKGKEKWVTVANAVLAKCKADGGEDCDAMAIKVANAAVKESAEESVVTEASEAVLVELAEMVNLGEMVLPG